MRASRSLVGALAVTLCSAALNAGIRGTSRKLYSTKKIISKETIFLWSKHCRLQGADDFLKFKEFELIAFFDILITFEVEIALKTRL